MCLKCIVLSPPLFSLSFSLIPTSTSICCHGNCVWSPLPCPSIWAPYFFPTPFFSSFPLSFLLLLFVFWGASHNPPLCYFLQFFPCYLFFLQTYQPTSTQSPHTTILNYASPMNCSHDVIGHPDRGCIMRCNHLISTLTLSLLLYFSAIIMMAFQPCEYIFTGPHNIEGLFRSGLR